MTINITKAGDTKRLDPEHAVSCNRCGCEFTCNQSDTHPSPDPRDIGILGIACPTCGHYLFFSKEGKR